MKQKTKYLRKNFLNSQRGITLIALVVTIIVYLISYDKKVEYSI